MKTKWYRETIEALGMRVTKARVINKLNAVYAHTEDTKLRQYAADLVSEIKSASSCTSVMAPIDRKRGVPSAQKVMEYCRPLAHPEDFQ